MEASRKPTLMQRQYSLPKKIIITTAVMFALILYVYNSGIPNPNMILIAGSCCAPRCSGSAGGSSRR